MGKRALPGNTIRKSDKLSETSFSKSESHFVLPVYSLLAEDGDAGACDPSGEWGVGREEWGVGSGTLYTNNLNKLIRALLTKQADYRLLIWPDTVCRCLRQYRALYLGGYNEF